MKTRGWLANEKKKINMITTKSRCIYLLLEKMCIFVSTKQNTMKKALLCISATVFLLNISHAQQIENPGFETWDGTGATLEPVNWSSLKTSDDSFLSSSAPVVLSQDTGRENGFSVKLENKSVFNVVANGLLTNGRVHADFNPANGYVFTDATDPRWNTPLTSRPDSIVGWYKYQPSSANGNIDKGKVEVLLHKTGTGQMPETSSTAANTVGRARFDMIQPSATWVRFSVPFNYVSSDNPEYILIILTSGDSTAAVNGSIAWFDDLQLIYNDAVSTPQEIQKEFSVAQFNASLRIRDLTIGSQFEIYNALGQPITSGVAAQETLLIDIPQTGVYFVRVSNATGILTKKIVIVKD